MLINLKMFTVKIMDFLFCLHKNNMDVLHFSCQSAEVNRVCSNCSALPLALPHSSPGSVGRLAREKEITSHPEMGVQFCASCQSVFVERGSLNLPSSNGASTKREYLRKQNGTKHTNNKLFDNQAVTFFPY